MQDYPMVINDGDDIQMVFEAVLQSIVRKVYKFFIDNIFTCLRKRNFGRRELSCPQNIYSNPLMNVISYGL